MFINDKLASETPEGSVISRGVESALFILTTCQPFETKREIYLEPCCARLWSLANVSQT